MIEKNAKFIKKITDYLSEERYNRALLIDGKWGAGKTYFAKNILVKALTGDSEEKRETKPVIYLSLYGVDSKEDLIDKLRKEYLKALSTFYNDNADKIADLLGVAKIVTNIFGKSEKIVENIENLTAVKNFLDVKNVYIIFDDLERSDLNISISLGSINELVEHNNVKAIVIANEKHIVEKFNEYKEIKEKTIGRTLVFDYDNFIEVCNTYTKNYEQMSKYYRLIKQCFEMNYSNNMRTLINAIVITEKFLETLQDVCVNDGVARDSEINDLVRYIIKACICYYEHNNIYPREMDFDRVILDGDFALQSILVYKVDTYTLSSKEKTPFAYKCVRDYIVCGEYDEESIIQQFKVFINNRKKVLAYTNENENKLSMWSRCNSDKIGNIVDKVLDDIKEGKCSELLFKNILSVVVKLNALGLKSAGDKTYVEKCVEAIVLNIENSKAKDNNNDSDTVKDQLAVKKINNIVELIPENELEENSDIYKAFEGKFETIICTVEDEKIDLADLRFWNEKYKDYYESVYVDIDDESFFADLNLDVFKESLIKSNNEQFSCFFNTIEAFYSDNIQFQIFKEEDSYKLRDVIRIMDEYLADSNSNDFLKIYNIRQFISTFDAEPEVDLDSEM